MGTLERPDEYDPVQTKTNDKLTDEHTDDLEHEKTANMKQGRYVLFCCIYFICPWLTDELMCVLSGPPCMDVRDGCTLRAPFSLRFTAHVVEQFRVEREGSGRLQCANLRVGYLHYYECANLSNPKLTMNITGPGTGISSRRAHLFHQYSTSPSRSTS